MQGLKLNMSSMIRIMRLTSAHSVALKSMMKTSQMKMNE